MFLKQKRWGKGITIALAFVFLFQCMGLMMPEIASAATTELTITKYAVDGTTILAQRTVDYQWLMDPDNIPVLGDGETHYYCQGPVFKDDPNPEEQERLRWNEEEDQNWDTKDMGALKGTNVKDLCYLVGDMKEGDILKFKASDGLVKSFAYKNVYEYNPEREGPMVVTWYQDGMYPDTGYTDGMRLMWFAGATYKEGPTSIEGLPSGDYHVFGNWDWHEAADPKYWYYYNNQYPTTTGLSVQKVLELNIYSNEPVPEKEAPVAAFTADKTSGIAPLTVEFTDQSTNDPTSWEWDFDDDGVVDSTLQNPTYEFETAGIYTIKLTAANDSGSDSIIQTDYIIVSEPAGAKLQLMSDYGIPGVNVFIIGTGFAADAAGTVWFDTNNNEVLDDGEPSIALTTNGDGDFPLLTSLIIPSVSTGNYNVRADFGKDETAAVFTVDDSGIIVSPTSGNSQMQDPRYITVTGTGFPASTPYRLFVDRNGNGIFDDGAYKFGNTSADGTINITNLSWPSSPAGIYNILLDIGRTDNIEASAGVGIVPGLKITTPRGVPGTNIGMNLVGFAAEAEGYVWFDANDNGVWDEGENKADLNTNAAGAAATPGLTVPDILPGNYKVCTEIPAYGLQAAADYGLTGMVLNTSSGTVGTNIDVMGYGLVANQNGKYVWFDTDDNGSWDEGEVKADVTTDDIGTMSLATLMVPDVPAGIYNVRTNASPAGTYASFTVKNPEPEIDIIYDGTVDLDPSGTYTVTIGGQEYTIGQATPLGALENAARAGGFTYAASAKKWEDSGILLLDDIGAYPYEKNGSRWNAYVNGVFKDGYDAVADALNMIELIDGDKVEFYYVHKDTDKNDLDAVKAAATAAVKTVASTSAADVLFNGTVALDPGETFTITIGSNQYPIDQNTPLGALHAASIAKGFTYKASDKKWGDSGILLLDDIGDYPYVKGGSQWRAYVNDVFKDGYADADDALNKVELFEGDRVEYYYAAGVDSADLAAVKAAATAAVKMVAVTGEAPTEWTLQLTGARDENVSRDYFEEGLLCRETHRASWTDEEGNVWAGVPLWLLVGMVDDNPDMGNKHINFNDELAAQDYEIKIIAGDGWSTTLSSKDIARSDAYIIANTLNGEPLPLKTESDKGCWPLHLKGSAIAGGQQVGNIVRIELSGLPEPQAGWTLELLGDIGDTITQEEFEEATKCLHDAKWTDIDGNEWSGIPLWVLLGAVDDLEMTGNHWTFDESLAADYTVKVSAGDGFSKTFAGADVANRNDYIVANKMNGEPLPENLAPLRLVGNGVTDEEGVLKGMAVGQIAMIEIPELQTPPAAEGSWNLSLKGKITDVMPQEEFETGAYCPDSGHLATWTDGEGNEWSGMPLWLLAGWVDDRKPHSYDFPQALDGYKIIVKASDGYSIDLDSKDINKNNNYIVANKVNGEYLTDSWPLRLVGPGVAGEGGKLGGLSVGNIVEIKLTSFATGGSGIIPDLRIVKLGQDGVTVVDEITLNYLDMMDRFDVYGDGETVYKYQGITNNPDDIWSPDDETVGGFKVANAIKGTLVRDLVGLVGGMGTGTDVDFVAKDGWVTTMPYSSIHPDPAVFARQGEAVLAWYADGQYVPDYKDGMRLFFTPEDTIYGQWDMHESLPEPYWHYYYGDVMYPSCAGVSPKYINEIRVYSVPVEDWTLELDGLEMEGGLHKEISKNYFEDALTCTFGADHKKTYTDSDGRVWGGMPLWLLVGFVDDADQHSSYAFNADLAASGAYQVVIAAEDGFTVTIDSTEIARNLDFLVANTVDGLLMTDADSNWPLKLVGPAVSGKMSIGNIASIKLVPVAAGAAKYSVAPAADPTYTIGETPAGIKTMTVNAGITGLNYFTVDIAPIVSHSGNETVVFTHMRNGSQLQINATRADFDLVGTAKAGFNVTAGDIVRVYIVDELTNDVDRNPVMLQ